jgi:hypothetical protein
MIPPAHQIDVETLLTVHDGLTADVVEQAQISPRNAAPFNAAAETAARFIQTPSIHERPDHDDRN